LLAIFLSLKAICGTGYRHVKIMSDNATAISYINNMGGTKSSKCNEIAKDIWLWGVKNKTWLSAAFIPGKENHEADRASRQFNDATEWMLNTNVFNEITLAFGHPSIDLFASRCNKQIERYVAWKPEPEAVAIDAFSFSWTDEFSFIFPPFSVLGQTVAKIQRERVKGILIIPQWPTQPWYPAVLRLGAKKLNFGPMRDLLTLSHKPEEVHPLAQKLTLTAILLD